MRRLASLAIIVGLAVAAFAYVQSANPDWWIHLRYPLRYQQIVRAHARHYRLDPALLAAVIYEESKFRPNVKSKSGAIGLMQLLPATAKGIAIHTGGTRFRVQDLYDPELNVRYGAWYLRHLIDKYGAEKTALAAYNAGQQNVDRWRANGSGIPFPETRDYVRRIEHLKTLYRKGYRSELAASS